jgi:hypothetical protein
MNNILQKGWSVSADTEHCVHILIDDNIDLEGLELTLINDVRIPILKMKINTREIHICSHTEKPMFAQIGNSVKYVEGSGAEYYQNEN